MVRMHLQPKGLGLDSFLQLFFFFFGEKGGCNFPNENGPKFPKEMWAQNMAPQGKRV